VTGGTVIIGEVVIAAGLVYIIVFSEFAGIDGGIDPG
jgi:hypothetical protein